MDRTTIIAELITQYNKEYEIAAKQNMLNSVHWGQILRYYSELICIASSSKIMDR